MEPQSFLADTVLVLDTSIVINLNATGYAREILAAVGRRAVVVDVVVGELENGRSKGRSDAAMLVDLAATGVITIVPLGETALSHFESLVIGTSADTLDDGEAATIAYALDTSACPVIDERKATRLCKQRYPQLQQMGTVDLLSHQAVQRALGLSLLADALHRSLLSARMRVPTHHLDWVVTLIGNERAAACRCLPETVRHAARRALGVPL